MRYVLPLILAGCGAAEGDSCLLDSDCEGGLICLSSRCSTHEAVQSEFAPLADDAATPTTDTTAGDASERTETVAGPATHPCGEQPYSRTLLSCTPPSGVFEAGAAPCAEPTAKYPVKMVTMEPLGGFQKMAALATPVLTKGFEEGTIAVSLWQDGDLATNCQGDQIWVRDDADRNADCTGSFGPDSFPLTIPISNPPLFIVVRDAVFDLNTGRLTGIVDREKLIADLPEAIRETGATLVTADVDTDGDGTPEDSRVTLTVCF